MHEVNKTSHIPVKKIVANRSFTSAMLYTTAGASYSWEFGQIPPFRIQLKRFHQLVAAGCKDCLLSICFAYTISMAFPIELKNLFIVILINSARPIYSIDAKINKPLK